MLDKAEYSAFESTLNSSFVSYLGLPRVLEYSSTTRVVNYSSNILLLEYSLISISGCKFPNCSFNNAPVHLLFSNLACGSALDRRASL